MFGYSFGQREVFSKMTYAHVQLTEARPTCLMSMALEDGSVFVRFESPGKKILFKVFIRVMFYQIATAL